MTGPIMEGRLWVVTTPRADGGTDLLLTMTEPVTRAESQGVVRSRGMVSQDTTIVVPPAPQPAVTRVEFTVTLTDAYAVGLAAGGASKRIACAGLKTTNSLSVQALAVLPDGYAICTVSCTENGWARIGFVRPLLAIGAAHALPLKITALR